MNLCIFVCLFLSVFIYHALYVKRRYVHECTNVVHTSVPQVSEVNVTVTPTFNSRRHRCLPSQYKVFYADNTTIPVTYDSSTLLKSYVEKMEIIRNSLIRKVLRSRRGESYREGRGVVCLVTRVVVKVRTGRERNPLVELGTFIILSQLLIGSSKTSVTTNTKKL